MFSYIESLIMSSTPSRKRKCTFTDDLKTKYPCFDTGRDEYESKCLICKDYVKICYRGAGDIERHLQTEKHKKALRSVASTSKVETFFPPKFTPIDKKVQAAEATLAFHTVRHHQSFNSTDCTSKLHRVIYPDSQVAKSVRSGRTKTAAIVNNVLATHCLDETVKTLQTDVSYFGMGTDASNHKNLKLFPIVIQYFDRENGVQSKLLNLEETKNETAETIFLYLKKSLEEHKLLSKCIAYGADNANVNFGGPEHKEGQNVLSLLKSRINKEMIGVGCPGHILHNAMQHGADTLSVDLESIVMKIFNYFHVYTVRTEELKDFCDDVGVTYCSLLRHVKVRWLSLFPAIEKILKIYPALKLYFLSQPKIPVLIRQFFENELSETYLWFVHSNMHVFHIKIAQLERENSSVVEVSNIINSVSSMLKTRLEQNFLSIKVRSLLKSVKAEGLEIECQKFKSEAKEFYQTCTDYLEKWSAPIAEFACFNWMDFDKMNDVQFDAITESVIYLQTKNVDIDDSKLFDQFCLLQSYVSTLNLEDEVEALDARWCNFFKKFPLPDQNSELLKICNFFFLYLLITLTSSAFFRSSTLNGATKEINC